MTNSVKTVAKRSKPEDNFGRKFGNGGHLTITGLHNTCRLGGSRIFKVRCSTCAEDPELFDDGVFYANLHNLSKGITPCGCSKKPIWSAEQYLVRTRRAVKDTPCEVLGYAEPFKGCETKLHLKCKVHGTEWKHTTARTAVNTARYSAMCADCESEFLSARFASKEDTQADEIISSGRFPAGTKLWRATSKNHKSVWGMLCGKCSSDEFVENSLCTGVFETTLGSLRDGHRPCRCSDKYKYNTHQRRHQIEKIRSDTEATWVFTGYKAGTFERNIRMQGYCNIHGVFEKRVSQFVSKSGGCPGCSTGGGFKSSKAAHVYVLGVEGAVGSFTGYGISNRISARIVDHIRNLASANLYITRQEMIACTGQEAHKIESEIKSLFPVKRQEVCGFKTEATCHERFEEIVKFVYRRVDELSNYASVNEIP